MCSGPGFSSAPRETSEEPDDGRTRRSPSGHRGRASCGSRSCRCRDLKKSLRRPRTLFSVLMNAVTAGLTLIALVPLFSVVYMLLVKGIQAIHWASFTSLPPAALEEGGGFGNAIVGTLHHGWHRRTAERAAGHPGGGVSGRSRARNSGWPTWSGSAPRCSAAFPRFWRACLPTERWCC